jgi:hypothetical protein
MLVVRVQRFVQRARVALLGLALPLATLLPSMLAGCGFPAPEACELACGENGDCPGGFECQAQTDRCVPLSRTTPCTLRDELPNRPSEQPSDTDAGKGGASPGAGGFGGAAGTPEPDSGAAGSDTAGASGAGGVPNQQPDPDALVILVDDPSTESSCTGIELSRTLRAAGGTGPYAWRLLDAPPGIGLSGASGEAVSLSGVPSAPGRVLVELEDDAGWWVESELTTVFETPEVESLSLPAYCAGALYSTELFALGGDGEHVWSAVLVPVSGQPGSLAELGLSVFGSALSGELAATDQELGPFRLALSVRDDHCVSPEVEVELDVEPGDSDACPSIQVADSAFDELPPACLGSSFEAVLSAEGGEPPYTWTELSAPPGVYLDPESASILGVAEGDGVLTVALTDAGSRTVQKSYAIEARDSCWLAYVASEPWPARLELVDGRLLESQPDAARRSFPVAGADPVSDFEFSPDGAFVAYRLGTDPSALRIELARLSDGVSRALDFSGSVSAYAWSEDAASLALALASGSDASLAGLDVATSRPIAQRAVPSVDSGLRWFGPGRLAFLSREPAPPGRLRLVTVARTRSGFDAPFVRSELDFSDAARLVTGAGGVFVAEPETGGQHFFGNDGGPPVSHGEDLVLAAAGNWLGAARAGALQLFRPADASGLTSTPFLGAPGCTALVGWASGFDRIACVDERGAQNAVVLFDVSSAPTPSARELAPIVAPYVYPVGVHSGHRRAFSRAGRWFAFASDETVYVTRLDGERPELAVALPSTALGLRPGVMLFAPDEDQLLLGAGNTLALLGLAPVADLEVLSASAVFDEACSERSADLAGWCGSESSTPDLAWSPGSDLVLFRSTLGTLQLLDMSRTRGGQRPAPLSPDPACSEACRSAQTARFQPRAARSAAFIKEVLRLE